MNPVYLGSRLLGALLTLFLASLFTFFALSLIPGDPALNLLGLGASTEALEKLRGQLGLNLPPLERYFSWLAHAVRGDLGQSIRYSESVSTLMFERVPLSLSLVGLCLLISSAISLFLGILAAGRPGRTLDVVLRVVLTVFSAIPSFWLGLLLILLFAVHWRVLPSSGFSGPKDLILPLLTLVLIRTSLLTRTVRGSLLEVLGQDYVRTARAKGLGRRAVLFKHTLRNALIPMVTILGLEFAELLTGAVIVENVFALPGLGTLVLRAIEARDFPLVQGVVLLLAALIVAVNLLIDLLYGLIDPRIHYA